MNLKSLFAGGVSGETYGQGVRRRSGSIAMVWALGLASIALTYVAYSLSGSAWATLCVATICGLASSRADLGFDPVKGDAPKKSDKLLWLILFAPALVLLGAVSVYTALHARDGFDVFKAGLTAGMFGWVLGLTLMLLGAGSRVTAKIGEG